MDAHAEKSKNLSLDDIRQNNRIRGRDSRRRGSFLRSACSGRRGIKRLNIRRNDDNTRRKAISQEQKDQEVINGTLVVSNLHSGVSERDIEELFCLTSPVTKVKLLSEPSGKSLDSAEVIFEGIHDARAAKQLYDGVSLKGRPLNIHLAGGEVSPKRKRKNKKEMEFTWSPIDVLSPSPGPTNFVNRKKKKTLTVEELTDKIEKDMEKMKLQNSN